MSAKIETFAELQRMIRKALRQQNPEWVDTHGDLVLFGAIQGKGRVEHAPAR
jgi:hypothetical protein